MKKTQTPFQMGLDEIVSNLIEMGLGVYRDTKTLEIKSPVSGLGLTFTLPDFDNAVFRAYIACKMGQSIEIRKRDTETVMPLGDLRKRHIESQPTLDDKCVCPTEQFMHSDDCPVAQSALEFNPDVDTLDDDEDEESALQGHEDERDRENAKQTLISRHGANVFNHLDSIANGSYGWGLSHERIEDTAIAFWIEDGRYLTWKDFVDNYLLWLQTNVKFEGRDTSEDAQFDEHMHGVLKDELVEHLTQYWDRKSDGCIPSLFATIVHCITDTNTLRRIRQAVPRVEITPTGTQDVAQPDTVEILRNLRKDLDGILSQFNVEQCPDICTVLSAELTCEQLRNAIALLSQRLTK